MTLLFKSLHYNKNNAMNDNKLNSCFLFYKKKKILDLTLSNQVIAFFKMFNKNCTFNSILLFSILSVLKRAHRARN